MPEIMFLKISICMYDFTIDEIQCIYKNHLFSLKLKVMYKNSQGPSGVWSLK